MKWENIIIFLVWYVIVKYCDIRLSILKIKIGVVYLMYKDNILKVYKYLSWDFVKFILVKMRSFLCEVVYIYDYRIWDIEIGGLFKIN